MDKEKQIAKNHRIKETMRATKERRAGMRCVTRRVKVQRSKTSKAQREEARRLFLEAKWFYNTVVFSDDIFQFDEKVKAVRIKCGESYDERELTILGSQIKQSILKRATDNIKGLASSKQKGRRVGRLKGKRKVASIPLKQYGNTFDIDFDKKQVKVVNISKPFRVKGLEQIPEDSDIAEAKFIDKASGLYFDVTYYEPIEEKVSTHKDVGIDFGIKDNITTSDGEFFSVNVSETDRVKKASRAYNKGLIRNKNNKNSLSSRRRRKNLILAYEKQNNKKKDRVNKICSYLLSEYDIIAIQDEMIANWQKGLFGKQVQHSAMGKIICGLKNSPQTIVIEKSYPSTQVCPKCGCLTKHPLEKRDYYCSHCHYHHPSRDIKSAQSILDYALSKVCPERASSSPAKTESPTVRCAGFSAFTESQVSVAVPIVSNAGRSRKPSPEIRRVG